MSSDVCENNDYGNVDQELDSNYYNRLSQIFFLYKIYFFKEIPICFNHNDQLFPNCWIGYHILFGFPPTWNDISETNKDIEKSS